MYTSGRQIASALSHGNIRFYAIWVILTHLSFLYRHIARQGGTVVTALSWCPTKNHLAWTDGSGEFFQWQKPISDGQPDPVKVINSSTTAKPRADLDLFGEEPLDTGTSALALDQNIDAEVEAEDDYDNWIVDDLGGGMQDEPTAGPKASDGYVKEMGE